MLARLRQRWSSLAGVVTLAALFALALISAAGHRWG